MMATKLHFPDDQALLALIRGRVEEGRATGIVLGVLEADEGVVYAVIFSRRDDVYWIIRSAARF
jgi:hypothetical protein